MRTKQIIGIACTALALGLVACEKKEAPKPTPPKAGTDALKGATDAVKDAAKSAGDTVDKVAKEAKDKAVATAQGLYDSAKKEFDSLAAKVTASSSPEKPVWQKAVDGIKAQFGEADTKMSDLKADKSDWKKLSEEFSGLMTKISDGIKSLASQVK